MTPSSSPRRRWINCSSHRCCSGASPAWHCLARSTCLSAAARNASRRAASSADGSSIDGDETQDLRGDDAHRLGAAVVEVPGGDRLVRGADDALGPLVGELVGHLHERVRRDLQLLGAVGAEVRGTTAVVVAVSAAYWANESAAARTSARSAPSRTNSTGRDGAGRPATGPGSAAPRPDVLSSRRRSEDRGAVQTAVLDVDARLAVLEDDEGDGLVEPAVAAVAVQQVVAGAPAWSAGAKSSRHRQNSAVSTSSSAAAFAGSRASSVPGVRGPVRAGHGREVPDGRVALGARLRRPSGPPGAPPTRSRASGGAVGVRARPSGTCCPGGTPGCAGPSTGRATAAE